MIPGLLVEKHWPQRPLDSRGPAGQTPPLTRLMGVECPETQRDPGCVVPRPWSKSLLEGELVTPRDSGVTVLSGGNLGWKGSVSSPTPSYPTCLRSVPRTPEASSFVAILLGMLVPVVVIVPAVTWECVSRKRRRRR